MSQQVRPGSEVRVDVQVLDADGNHAAATIDTTQTRLEGHSDTVPTIGTLGTGRYTITFSGVTPNVENGDILECVVHGQIDAVGEPWTPYGIRIEVWEPGLQIGKSYKYTNDAQGVGTDDVTITEIP